MTDHVYDVTFEASPEVAADLAHKALLDAVSQLFDTDPRLLDVISLEIAVTHLLELRSTARRAQT